MEILIGLLGTIVALGLLALSSLFLLHGIARKSWQATVVQSGGFKFVTQGESILKILDNLDDYYVDTRSSKVLQKTDRSGKPRTKGFLERKFGIYWVSWIYPVKQIHHFEVVADKMKSEEEISRENLAVRNYIDTSLREVEYLRFRFPHPVLISDVELGKDKWKVDIIMMLDIMITNPVTVVFDYKGKVLRQVDAAVRAAVIDMFNEPDMDYNTFISRDKGSASPFSECILALNERTTDRPERDGLEERFGVSIRAAWAEAVDLSPEQKELDTAAKSIEKNKLEAQAKEEEARGTQAAERLSRHGIGEGIQLIVQHLINAGVSPDQAAAIAHEQVRTGNIAGPQSKITTYIEGGARVLPTVPVGEKKGEE